MVVCTSVNCTIGKVYSVHLTWQKARQWLGKSKIKWMYFTFDFFFFHFVFYIFLHLRYFFFFLSFAVECFKSIWKKNLVPLSQHLLPLLLWVYFVSRMLKWTVLCMFKSHFFPVTHSSLASESTRQTASDWLWDFYWVTYAHEMPGKVQVHFGAQSELSLVLLCNSISGKSRMHQLQDTQRTFTG